MHGVISRFYLHGLKPGWLIILCLLFCFGARAEGGRLYIEARINDQPVRLVFDTGAGASILFRPTAQALGLSITNTPADPNPAGGRVHVDWTETFNLVLGDSTNVYRANFGVVDIPSFMISDVVGMVAWSSVKRNLLYIDAIDHRFMAIKQLPDDISTWQKLEIRTNISVLALKVRDRVRGGRSVFIDTGNDGGVCVSQAEWDEWTKAHPTAPRTINASYTPGLGLVVAEESWADKITLGSLVLTQVPITVGGIAAVTDPEGEPVTLGVAALNRLDLIIDGEGGCVYARPGKVPPVPYEHNRLGAVFVPDNFETSKYLKARVIKGSPAAEAGIRDGDVLLNIGALDATKWRTDPGVMPVGRFWTQPAGTKINLSLRRGDREYKTVVTLRDLIGPTKANGA